VNDISDEMLMAYADGELDDRARAKVDAYLITSIEAAQRLEIFLATGRGLSDLFEQPMHEPVPQRLLDVIAAPASVIAFPGASARRRQNRQQFWPTTLAASLAMLAIGSSVFWFKNRVFTNSGEAFGVARSEQGDRVAVDTLAEVLETTAVGISTLVTVSGQRATVKPVFTFATAEKTYCRQYVIAKDETAAYGGVACRAPNGQWRIEAQQAVAAASSSAPEKAKQIAPASGTTDGNEIEATVDRLIAGDVLSIEAEASAMARKWQPAP
jgi:surface antigen